MRLQPQISSALAAAIDNVLCIDEEELMQIGAKVREQVVRKYSLEANTKKYLELYGEDFLLINLFLI